LLELFKKISGGLQRLAVLEKVVPSLRFSEPLGEVAQIEIGGDDRGVYLRPIEGCGDGRFGAQTHAERRHDGLTEAVAKGIL
jgi:hypothetical protein